MSNTCAVTIAAPLMGFMGPAGVSVRGRAAARGERVSDQWQIFCPALRRDPARGGKSSRASSSRRDGDGACARPRALELVNQAHDRRHDPDGARAPVGRNVFAAALSGCRADEHKRYAEMIR